MVVSQQASLCMPRLLPFQRRQDGLFIDGLGVEDGPGAAIGNTAGSAIHAAPVDGVFRVIVTVAYGLIVAVGWTCCYVFSKELLRQWGARKITLLNGS